MDFKNEYEIPEPEDEDNAYLAILKSFAASTEPSEGDYIQDGIPYCGKCHTPLRAYIDIPLPSGDVAQLLVPRQCDCRMAEIKAKEAADKVRKAKERAENWRRQGLSETTWHSATFANDDLRDANASGICRKFADGFTIATDEGMGLILFGGIGSGKTYLAACIANALIDKGIPVLMASLPSLVSQMNADYGDNKFEVLEQVQAIPLLIIDDFGVERETDYMIEQVYELINARYKTGKPLVITTNKSVGEMKSERSQSKQRIYDRIFEGCIPVRVRGESRRTAIAQERHKAFREWLGVEADNA